MPVTYENTFLFFIDGCYLATKNTVYLFHSFCRLLIIKLLNENSKSLTALFNQVHIIHLVGVVLCVLFVQSRFISLEVCW